MNWKDIKKVVGKSAPMLGTLIGGPAGAAVGSMISSALGVENTPEAVFDAVTTNPDALVKLREIEAKRQVELQALVADQAKAEINATVKNASDVNVTMQAETKSEHFLQYSWRPFIGYSIAANLIGNTLTVLVAYLAVIMEWAQPEALSQLPSMLAASSALVAVAAPIVGVASWHRGKQKVQEALNQGTKTA